jgi:hypothetical protein
LTTGTIEGIIHAADGHRLAGVPIVISGGTGFAIAIHSDSKGEFSTTLPCGQYQLSGAAIVIAPWQTVRVDATVDGSGQVRVTQAPVRMSDLWNDDTRGARYPEGFSLAGLLMSREPSIVTEPPDFTGLRDNRLVAVSQRALSWTSTPYRLDGMNAADSYQPGFPVVAADIEAQEAVVVRSSAGTIVGLFPGEARAKWHGALSTRYTGSALSWNNLPPPADRGLVLQNDRYQWLTRDRFEIGGHWGSE